MYMLYTYDRDAKSIVCHGWPWMFFFCEFLLTILPQFEEFPKLVGILQILDWVLFYDIWPSQLYYRLSRFPKIARRFLHLWPDWTLQAKICFTSIFYRGENLKKIKSYFAGSINYSFLCFQFHCMYRTLIWISFIYKIRNMPSFLCNDFCV